jgi:hypothetical protein
VNLAEEVRLEIENLDLRNAVLSGGSSSATVTLANDSFSRNVTIAHGLTIDEIAPVTFDSSTVTNQAGSTYDVGVIGSAFVAGVGVSRFINKGTLAQTSLADAGSLGVSNIYVNVTDTGTLSVEGGSNLRFFGAHNSFSGTYVGAGMVDYWTGSINALGTINMTNGACTTVDGAIVNQNGVVTLSVNSTITNYGTWNFTSNNGLALADPSQPSSSTAAFTLYDALAKIDDFLVAFVNRAHHDAVYGSAIVRNDDHILCRIHEFAGEITGVRGFQRRIGKAFARTMGGNEVLQHGESFAEI